MGKSTGKNAAISFGGTLYRCLTQLESSEDAEIASAACSQETGSAAMYKAVGAVNSKVSVTVLTDDNAVALETAFKAGTSGELILYPHGTAVGMISETWSNAIVSSKAKSVAVATQAQMAVSFECDGISVDAVVTA